MELSRCDCNRWHRRRVTAGRRCGWLTSCGDGSARVALRHPARCMRVNARDGSAEHRRGRKGGRAEGMALHQQQQRPQRHKCRERTAAKAIRAGHQSRRKSEARRNVHSHHLVAITALLDQLSPAVGSLCLQPIAGEHAATSFCRWCRCIERRRLPLIEFCCQSLFAERFGSDKQRAVAAAVALAIPRRRVRSLPTERSRKQR